VDVIAPREASDVATPASASEASWLDRRDLIALFALLVVTLLNFWVQARLDPLFFYSDVLTFYLPHYAEMGNRVRELALPGWNPWLFAGMPLAGDPQTGWGYLPVMSLFALLGPLGAYQAYVFFHLLLSSVATYALGRRLGLTALGAGAAGLAYQLGPLSEYSSCCTDRMQVSPWIPLGMLTVELGVRARDRTMRFLWWGATGLVFAQISAIVFGKLTYYAILAIGAYAFYRTLIDPLAPGDLRHRIRQMLMHCSAILLFGLGFSAANVLPRLDFINRSNLAGGDYSSFDSEQAASAGWTVGRLLKNLITLDVLYYGLGAVVMALAVAGIVLAGRRHAAPFFITLSGLVAALALAPNPVHSLFYLLPMFETLHEHVMARIMVAFNIGPVLLAGMAITAIQRRSASPQRLLIAAFAVLGATIVTVEFTESARVRFGDGPRETLVIVAMLIGLAAFGRMVWRGRSGRTGALVANGIAVVAVLMLLWNLGEVRIDRGREAGFSVPPLAGVTQAYADPVDAGDAGEFLRTITADEPGRFAGYDALYLSGLLHFRPYYHSFEQNLRTEALLVNDRAVLVGIEDIQGYNPVHYARYVEYIDAMNRRTQAYHETNLFPSGISSPLFDLLNVRYVIVPRAIPPGRPDLLRLSQLFPTVYIDDDVRVLENPNAFPRAWVVHEAEQVAEGEALERLTSGEIDPRQTVLIESSPPPLAQPASDSIVTFELREPERIRLTTNTSADGMLVLSELHDPAWRAYVDGERVEVAVANHIFRAIALPAGEHTVEFRYESTSLRLGIAITTATSALLIVMAVWVVVRRYREREKPYGLKP
jgi:hypothetical protein